MITTSDKSASDNSGAGGTSVYVCFISAIAALGGFLFGFDSGVINGTVTALS